MSMKINLHKSDWHVVGRTQQLIIPLFYIDGWYCVCLRLRCYDNMLQVTSDCQEGFKNLT